MSANTNQLLDKILAGKASANKDEIINTTDEIISLLKDYSEEGNIVLNEENIILAKKILAQVVETGFDKNLMSTISSDLFYDFGKAISTIGDADFELIYTYLNLFRQPEFLKRIYNDKRWENLVLELIEKSNYNTSILFLQRVEQYKSKTLFKTIKGDLTTNYSWIKCSEIIKKYKSAFSGLLKTQAEHNDYVAFLLENSLDMALLDLTCLTSGIPNIMIPANSVPQHIEFILNQTKAAFILVDDEIQLSKLKSIKVNLKYLKKAVLVNGSSAEDWVISFNQFLSLASSADENLLKRLSESITPDSLATIMYTSGTTGEPKGIMFSHMNIVYKRFCRAMAIPGIGDEDRFLAFLPLYHTFGRWLEMMGSVFWGAEYCFMENPAVETMIHNFKMVKPSIFISIPKKWIQLYEYITARVDIETESEQIILDQVKESTGGNLKWGLSAAGYLPPDIFMFFQRNGIQIMSGFGMTEATGGITMTPPFEYIPNSLGKALPGIEIKVAEDGELLIRGAYVMLGYYGEEKSETFIDGWLPTGDIMKIDDAGFIEIIDRKKEIYKNIKGETVAPQKIENLFRDFETVKQVFLVGDHRPYNTVLINPDLETEGSPLNKMDEQQLQDYFSTVIVTVNNFLAPFERILDFRLIDRPISEKHGELTPKGTYKRRVIENNFDSLIESMYKKAHIEFFVGKVKVRIPNWFLREKSALSRDVVAKTESLEISKLNLSLTIKLVSDSPALIQVGSFIYQMKSNNLDLQEFFTNPVYWLGNKEIFEFCGSEIIQWCRKDHKISEISFKQKSDAPVNNLEWISEFESIYEKGEYSLYSLNLALLIIQSDDIAITKNPLNFINTVLEDDKHELYNFTFESASRPVLCKVIEIKRKLLSSLLIRARKDKFKKVFISFLEDNFEILNDELIKHIDKISRGDENLTEIEDTLEYFTNNIPSGASLTKTPIPSLLQLLVSYGINHPVTYKRIRRTLLKYELYSKVKRLSHLAIKSRLELRKGLRNWLGANQKIAIDPETSEEYTWEDVLVFEESMDIADKHLIADAMIENPLIREAVFLFSGGVLIMLNNILPSGVWISLLNSSEQRNIYRISVQTRFQGSYDFTLHINKEISLTDLEEEIKWIIMAGKEIRGERIASRFGGLWEEYNLWTEEYLAGESVARHIKREYQSNDDQAIIRLKNLWPFFVWNASAAYLKFWKLTDYKLELENSTPANVIIPTHDYQTGTQITSFYIRNKNASWYEFVYNFYKNFVLGVEEKFPLIKEIIVWPSILSSICEIEGTDRGVEIIQKLKKEILKRNGPLSTNEIIQETDSFLKNIKLNGFLPKQLYFAIKRFNRWFKLNKDASLSAQAETLYDLYETYRLFEIEEDYPATRTRFFIETVFIDSTEKFKEVMRDIIKKQRQKKLSKDESIKMIGNISFEFALSEKEQFFLTRLSYPHLKPTDSAMFLKVSSSASTSSGLVVQQKDNDGNPYQLRNPINPKEISRLHKLFIEASLIVNFRPEHNYLVAISDRGFIIGGLFYYRNDEETVHMEKIVVSGRYRRKGISESLMNELFSRMKAENIKFVTTGFFRPEYFYRFGFKIERKYSGLVKEL